MGSKTLGIMYLELWLEPWKCKMVRKARAWGAWGSWGSSLAREKEGTTQEQSGAREEQREARIREAPQKGGQSAVLYVAWYKLICSHNLISTKR